MLNGSQHGQAASSPASRHFVAGSALVQHWALRCSSDDRTRGQRHLGLLLRIIVISNGRTLGPWGQFTFFTKALETHVSLDS